MKRSAKMALALGAALAVGAAALPAFSQDWGMGRGGYGPGGGHEMMQGGGEHHRRGPEGGHGPRGAGPEGGFGHGREAGLMRALAKDADSDGDGIVSPEELRAALERKLAEYDANGDGTLSLEEFEALHSALIRPQMVDRFQVLDEDGDGKVTAEEIAAPADHMERMMKRHERFGRGPEGGPGPRGERPGAEMPGGMMKRGN